MNWDIIFRHIVIPCSIFLVFYFNYFYLVPKYLLKENRNIRAFIFWNLAIAICYAFCFEIFIHAFMEPRNHANVDIRRFHDILELAMVGDSISIDSIERHRHEISRLMIHKMPVDKPSLPIWISAFGFIRNICVALSSAAAAVCIRLSLRWQKSEMERQKSEAARAEIEAAHQKSEAARAEAELKVLQHQVSPHFLLNCLNNIYSLIAFDSQQAQKCIVELSRILRYQLYESNSSHVLLSKEVEFLQNYISLMRIRMSNNTEVETDFQFDADKKQFIAPNILISLVENAFKHGVSPTAPSSIKIQLKADDDYISFHCENTNFPKEANVDKSGGGLGLKQVSKMLDLFYKDQYEWTKGISDDGLTYSSNIVIRLS